MDIIDDDDRIRTNDRVFTFSAVEIRDIAVAIVVLTISIALVFQKRRIFSNDVTVNALCWIGVSFVIIVLSFMLHELGHKFTAQRYGMWAEFRMFPVGLILSILISCVGVFFAAPGAVYIDGVLTKEKYGKISAAGPGINIIIGCIAALLLCTVSSEPLTSVLYSVAMINASFAFFNLFPISPFDGSKVFKWSARVYIVMYVATAALFFFLRKCI